MTIFLYGPDDYRRLERKRWYIAEFQKKHSNLGLGFFDLESPDAWSMLMEFAGNQSIFDTSKLAVLENAFAIEPAKLAKFLKPLTVDKNTNILIAESSKPVKALAFLLEKPTITQKFETLEGAEWASFINSEAKKLGLTLAAPATQFLGTVYAGNSWALITELQKISALKTSISKADLDALDLEVAPNYWGLLNGLKSFDIKNRLFALEKLFAMDDPPPKIFNILAAQAGEKIPRMAGYDIAIKSGKLDYEEALVDLAIS